MQPIRNIPWAQTVNSDKVQSLFGLQSDLREASHESTTLSISTAHQLLRESESVSTDARSFSEDIGI